MATKRRSRRKPKTVVPEEELLEEELLEEELEDELEDEEPEEEAPVKRTRRTRRQRKTEPEPRSHSTQADEELEDEDDEEEAPVKPTRRKRKRTAPSDVTADHQADKIGQVGATDLVDLFVELLGRNITIAIRKVGEVFLISEGATVQDTNVATYTDTGHEGRRNALTGAAFYKIAYSPEFLEFYPAWAKHSYEEKVVQAEEEGVEWERHENAKVDVMRLTAAYRIAKGIEKWRPEYLDRRARKILKEDGEDAAKAYIAAQSSVVEEEPNDDVEEPEEEAPVKKTARRSRKRTTKK